MEKSILKKCIAFGLLLTMIFALAACMVGNEDDMTIDVTLESELI